ncbi:MAG TPA: AsmA-like C-terminal region-containing protein [Acetobacteraceae bacterium]|nr:AsmA-like C-terminal region-containing protein [Acetobacteraceae bacterium]
MLRRVGQVCGHVGRHSFRLVRLLLEIALALTLLLAIAIGALAWRLSQGPIDLPWLAHRLEIAANTPPTATHYRIGGAALAWEGFKGVDRPLGVRLTAVQAIGPHGAVLDEIPRAEASFSLLSLLQGVIAPRAVEIDGARVRLVRQANGRATLDLGALPRPSATEAVPPGQGFARLLDELTRPPVVRARPASGGLQFDQLRRVLIRDARVEVIDRQIGATWRAPDADIDLKRDQRGVVTGTAGVTLALGATKARFSAIAHVAPGGTATDISAHLTPVTPADLARAVPALAPLAALDAPVTLAASAELGPDLLPRHLTLQAEGGAGAARMMGTAIGLKRVTLDLAGDLQAMTLHLQLALAAPDGSAGPVIRVAGDLGRAAQRVQAQLTIDLDRVPFADLGRYWPAGTGGGARPWLTENLTAGIAHDAHVALTLQAKPDLSDLALTAASGQVLGDDVTVHWLRPVPPIEHAQAKLQVLGPDAVQITAENGRQGALQMRDASMTITGLTTHDQEGAITVDIAGPIADAITLLRNPRLRLLSKHPLPLHDPSGTARIRLDVKLPLENKVAIEQIAIHAAGKLAAVHIGDLVAHRGLDQGALAIDASNDGLTLNGTATLAGIPLTLDVATDFRAGPPSEVLTRVSLSGTADARQLAAAGIDTAGMLHGPAALQVHYAQRRDGSATVTLAADLSRAALDAGMIDWRKPAGAPAALDAELLLQGDRITGVDAINASAPGLVLRGSAVMANGQPVALRLTEAAIGRTRASGEIRFAQDPGDPITVDLAGPVLDLSGQLARKPTPAHKPAQPATRGPPWAVQARFDRVLVAEGASLTAVQARIEDDGQVVRAATISSGAPEDIRVSIVPQGTGRHLSASAADAGAVLRAFDITGAIRGGKLSVQGQYDDRSAAHPLAGTAQIGDFRVRNAPAMAKLLQAMTLYGLVDALRGPGMGFTRLVAPFHMQDDQLQLDDARAFNASLGITAKGRIDLAANTADLQGTIVPAYMLNSFLGRIPLLGRLFSPERGGGVFAATYRVRGSLADPAVSVNPLAALAPGFLRGLFGMFGRH